MIRALKKLNKHGVLTLLTQKFQVQYIFEQYTF